MARSTGMPRWAQAVIGILSALIFVIVAANVDLGKTLDSWFVLQSRAETAEQVQTEKAIAVMADLLKAQQALTQGNEGARVALAVERGIEALGARLDRIAAALKERQEVDSKKVDSESTIHYPPSTAPNSEKPAPAEEERSQ